MANNFGGGGAREKDTQRPQGSGDRKFVSDMRQGETNYQNGGGRRSVPSNLEEWSEDGGREWAEVQRKKRQRANTGGDSSKVSLKEFDSLDIDDKLSRMMRILAPLEGLERSMATLTDDVRITREEVADIRTNVKGIEDRLLYVEYRAIDLESRSRKNNLLFFNIGETVWEKCEDSARKVIVERLGIASGRDMYLQRAHRLGKVKIGQNVRPRPIIVAFRDYRDIDLIMSEVTKLKGSGLGISRDYPQDINKARSKLSKAFLDAKVANKNPKIAFPAKLIIDGKVVKDEFPDWSRILYRHESTGDTSSARKAGTMKSPVRDHQASYHEENGAHRDNGRKAWTGKRLSEHRARDRGGERSPEDSD